MEHEAKAQDDVTPISTEIEATNEVEAPVTGEKRRVADRPHPVTVLLGLLSPSLALVALYFSRQTLDFNINALELAQRAYITTTFYTEKASMRGFENLWYLGVNIDNTGNTPATITKIEATQASDSLKDNYYIEKLPVQLVVGGKQVIKLQVARYNALNPSYARDLRTGKKIDVLVSIPLPTVSVSFQYTDIFSGSPHPASTKFKLAYSGGTFIDITPYSK